MLLHQIMRIEIGNRLAIAVFFEGEKKLRKFEQMCKTSSLRVPIWAPTGPQEKPMGLFFLSPPRLAPPSAPT